MIEVKVKKLSSDAQLPQTSIGNAGADLRACLYDEETGEKLTKIIIPAGGMAKINTKIAVQLPENHVMMIFPRSSMGVKKHLMLQNTTGVIDESYRGAVLLFVKNYGDRPVTIEDSERIAQAVVLPYPTVNYIEVDELDKTERGEGGFGSSGKF